MGILVPLTKPGTQQEGFTAALNGELSGMWRGCRGGCSSSVPRSQVPTPRLGSWGTPRMGGQPSSSPQGWAAQGAICGALLPSCGRWAEGGAARSGRREAGAQPCSWKLGHREDGDRPPGRRRQTSLPPTPVSLSRSALSLHAANEEWRGSKRGVGAGEGQGCPGNPRRVSKSHSSSQSTPTPAAPQAKAGRH